jgi:predicted ATPase/DNA-binding SARP family transcriptional activator
MRPEPLQPQSPPTLSICLFGPSEITCGGHPLPPFYSRKEVWLLALLTLRHDQALDRHQLAGLLWPDSQERQALYNLRRCLKNLRQGLQQHAGRITSPTPRSVRLDVAGAEVDVLAFDAALARGDAASLAQAVALYRGMLLEGCDQEWVMQERTVRAEGYLQALERLGEQARRRGEAAKARGYLRQVIEIDPFRERAQRGLMQALAESGDYAAAVQVYRALRLYLHREMKAEPDPQTTALFRRLQAQAKQQQAHAVHAPPPSVPPAPPPRRLPQPVSRLVGREQEIEEVSTGLSGVRLLTLTGTGGVGKTRLAIAVAEVVAEENPDGAYFVDLAPLVDPELIPQRVAAVLEVREQPGTPLMETLCDYLQRKALLLVLDNCEHLLDGCVSVVASLLERCKHLKILATSRQSLGIPGEFVWRVPSLPVPTLHPARAAEKAAVGVWMEYASVQLFVGQAQLVSPGFELSRSNAEWVISICQQLDGIPLALELAAARLRALEVEHLAARLSDRFGLLRGGNRSALPRQQTLLATLDWSYDLLTDPEQRLLSRLSVFAGGWTLDAAEQVCALPGRDERQEGSGEARSLLPDEVVDLLTGLVDKSLVVYETGRYETGRAAGDGRYRLLETIRQYGLERLAESGEVAVLQSRHLHYFLALAEEAEPHMQDSDGGFWLDRLATEYDNLRAALDWSLNAKGEETACASSCKPHPANHACLRLAGALWWFWGVRGDVSEGCAYLAKALACQGAARRTNERAMALRGNGYLAYLKGDYSIAKRHFEEMQAIGRERADNLCVSWSLFYLGVVALDQGDYSLARTLCEQSLSLQRDLGFTYGIAWSLHQLANVARAQGDYASARSLHKESLVMIRSYGNPDPNPDHIASSLTEQGNVARDQGDYQSATALYEESLAIKRTAGNRRGVAYALNNLGHVACSLGHHATASARFEESLTISAELGDKPGITAALNGLEWIAYCQGDYATAVALAEESLAVSWELGNQEGIARSLAAFARLGMAEGHLERAVWLWSAAEALRRVIGAPLPPDERPAYEHCLATVRQALGEEGFAGAWAAGQTMPLEQAFEYAMHDGHDAEE